MEKVHSKCICQGADDFLGLFSNGSTKVEIWENNGNKTKKK